MIKVKNITKTYGATVAVDDVSFEVGPGEILGFLGPNGAGKSTTLKIITSYVVADSGSVYVNDIEALENPMEVRKAIGYLPESTPLYIDMQVIEYLEFVARVRQMSGVEARSAIDRVVEMVGLRRMLRKNIGHLSKGYKQRVGIAQALVHDPGILIMDEPTSGLDPHQIIEIRELIRTLGKEKMIILSSHILQEISAIGTRIMIIKDGRIVADDTPQNMQRSLGDKTGFRARVQGPAEEVAAALKRLDGVNSVEITAGGGADTEFRLLTSAGEDIGSRVFKAVAGKGWELSALSPDEHSLEDVYLELTKDAVPTGAAGNGAAAQPSEESPAGEPEAAAVVQDAISEESGDDAPAQEQEGA
ncbi:MAG: ABC transporter [Planctomycetes bacterium]|nr:ABC transporter [Planctomycetota bacterium]